MRSGNYTRTILVYRLLLNYLNFLYTNTQQIKEYLSGEDLYTCLKHLKCPMGWKRLYRFGILKITRPREYIQFNYIHAFSWRFCTTSTAVVNFVFIKSFFNLFIDEHLIILYLTYYAKVLIIYCLFQLW